MSHRTTKGGAVQHPEGVNCSAIDAVMNHSESKGAQRLVLLAIARFINADSQEAYPSNPTIGKFANCDVRTVRRAVEQLIQLGELERGIQLSPLGTNLYRLPKLGGWGSSPSELHIDSIVKFSTNEDLNTYYRSLGGETPAPGKLPTELFALQLSYEFADAFIAAGRKKERFRSDAASDEWYGVFDRLVFEHFPQCSVECFRDVIARAAQPLPNGALIYHPGDLLGYWRVLEDEWRAAQPGPPAPPPRTVTTRASADELERLYASITGRDSVASDEEDLADCSEVVISSRRQHDDRG